ncbi:hypothetical protein DRO38_01015 [Candidatus Bathyarchaeota archaeon]|nr:MAG: hypothetical protein DRO38_01015 [Candidatus Bathyarchaeota archaeon]
MDPKKYCRFLLGKAAFSLLARQIRSALADLVLSYGKKAVVALQVKGVGPETAFRILGKMHFDEKEFYLDLLKAKIRFLRTRQYWDEKTPVAS